MDIPQKTTKIHAHQILIVVLILAAVGLFLLNARLYTGPKEPCLDNMVLLWEGEYPEPVVYVQEKHVQQGFVDMCLTHTQECHIEEGLYHPWAKEYLRFATYKEKEIYLSTGSFQSDVQSYPKGTEVIVEARLSQDVCMFRVGSDRWKEVCPDAQHFRLIVGTPHKKGRQFVEIPCTEGYKSWIEVNETLFEHTAISRGVIQGYGLVTAP